MATLTLLAGIIGACIAAVAIVGLWLWQANRARPAGAPTRNWRALLAVLPLPMLALAASYGVYEFARLFVPTWVAVIQAAAFECTYIGLAVSQLLDEKQRQRGRVIALGAVMTSIIYNTLAGWFHRHPALLADASPVADLMLALLHGAPLAWVAFLVSDLLLHGTPAGPRVEDVSQERDILRDERDSLVQERDALSREERRAWDAARAAETERDEAKVEADHWRAMAAQASRVAALPGDGETLEVGTKRVTLRGLSRALEIDKNKLSRAITRAGQEGE